jgi:hypothetical protein
MRKVELRACGSGGGCSRNAAAFRIAENQIRIRTGAGGSNAAGWDNSIAGGAVACAAPRNSSGMVLQSVRTGVFFCGVSQRPALQQPLCDAGNIKNSAQEMQPPHRKVVVRSRIRSVMENARNTVASIIST